MQIFNKTSFFCKQKITRSKQSKSINFPAISKENFLLAFKSCQLSTRSTSSWLTALPVQEQVSLHKMAFHDALALMVSYPLVYLLTVLVEPVLQLIIPYHVQKVAFHLSAIIKHCRIIVRSLPQLMQRLSHFQLQPVKLFNIKL